SGTFLVRPRGNPFRHSIFLPLAKATSGRSRSLRIELVRSIAPSARGSWKKVGESNCSIRNALLASKLVTARIVDQDHHFSVQLGSGFERFIFLPGPTFVGEKATHAGR